VKASVFIATSLDGFIARPDGSFDWLDVPGANEEHGFTAFMASIDALVMGRNTFDVVAAMGEWPYGDTPVIVLTHRPLDLPADLPGRIEASSLAPLELAGELDRRGLNRVYVDGGHTIRSFLDAGLVDRMTITTIPVLIGEGIPLFGPVHGDIHLRHVTTTIHGGGLVQSVYDVV
jgi:dihydrofolate reductase